MSRAVRLTVAALAVAALTGVVAPQVQAQAIITNGTGIYLGVNPLGHLNVPDGTGGISLTPTNSGYIGVYYAPVDGDATSPGCLCEGFGISASGIVGRAGIDIGGVSNLTPVAFASTAATATAVAELTSLPGYTVTHYFHPSASPDLMQVDVTLTNNTGATVTDIRYDRTMDWDIPPTTFNEFVTLQGWGATNLLNMCNDGFEVPNPLAACSPIFGFPADTNLTDIGPNDHGARFVFGFGDLLDGKSFSFTIFYGASATEALALAALGAVEAENVYSFGQQAGDPIGGTPATFIFGFKGVGGDVIDAPEPGTLLLMGLGLVGVARRFRR